MTLFAFVIILMAALFSVTAVNPAYSLMKHRGDNLCLNSLLHIRMHRQASAPTHRNVLFMLSPECTGNILLSLVELQRDCVFKAVEKQVIYFTQSRRCDLACALRKTQCLLIRARGFRQRLYSGLLGI